MKYLKLIVHMTLFISALISGVAFASQESPVASLNVIKPVMSCDSLVGMDLSSIGGKGSKITAAELIKNNGVDYCLVSGNLAPSIGFKVSLPTETWSQRYMQVGCGGLCGMISLMSGASQNCTLLQDGGFVTAATDMGHQGMSGDFGKDPQKRVDFAYRGQHLTTVATKKIIAAFYGSGPKYSYFNGCSDGGREALMEAQRYPNDFNGIIAGAPAANFQVQNNIYHAWMAQSNTDSHGHTILLADRLPLLHDAVLKQCDAIDGVKDGLISDPRACDFDVKTIQCPKDAKDTTNCLTSAEVGVVEKFYAGPTDPKTHEKLEIAGPMYGSELNWAGVSVPFTEHEMIFSEMVSLSSIRFVSFEENPGDQFPLNQYKINLDTFKKLEKLHPLYDALNPDLSQFKAAGGKLILWHGWADQHISPMNTIEYFNAVRREMGTTSAENFTRLYMLPGVAHCGGGEGLAGVNFVTPMMSWVETGHAPQAIMTQQQIKDSVLIFGQPNSGPDKGLPPKSKEEIQLAPKLHPQQPERSRPVYPYPYVAKFTGQGSANDAGNYVKGQPWVADDTTPTDWAGKAFFQPYKFIN